jgi:hypothetical protein
MLDPFTNPGRRHTEDAEVGGKGSAGTSIIVCYLRKDSCFVEMTIGPHLPDK